MKTAVEHWVYSNAAGEDGSGFRVVRAPTGWGEETLALTEWARQLRPAAPGPAHAAACFRLGQDLTAIGARVLGDFARDSHGRDGLLVHLLTAAVTEGHDIGLHHLALTTALAALESSPTQGLQAYLDALGSLSSTAVHPPSLAALETLDPKVLQPFLAAAADAFADGLSAPPLALAMPATLDRPLPQVLAAACGALPPRLRLAFRWGCGLSAKAAVHLHVEILPTPGEEAPSTGTTGRRTPYADWLSERLRQRDHEPIRRVLCDWNIRSWDDLLAVIA